MSEAVDAGSEATAEADILHLSLMDIKEPCVTKFKHLTVRRPICAALLSISTSRGLSGHMVRAAFVASTMSGGTPSVLFGAAIQNLRGREIPPPERQLSRLSEEQPKPRDTSVG